jgi:hypothetical protein
MTATANQNPEQIASDITYYAGFKYWQKCTIKKINTYKKTNKVQSTHLMLFILSPL